MSFAPSYSGTLTNSLFFQSPLFPFLIPRLVCLLVNFALLRLASKKEHANSTAALFFPSLSPLSAHFLGGISCS